MANTGDLKLKSGVIEHAGANTPGWVSNLGLTLSGGVLTVVDSQGEALTDENPGFVTVPSTTAGQLAVLKVTAGGVVNDDVNASSHLTNLGFGITETTAWANDMPFFLYVVNKANSDINSADGNSAFFLARHPSLATTPAAANDIGDTGAISVNDSQNVILIMDDVTVANYTSLPCQLIGSIRMRWSAVTADWTIQTLGNNDGFGETQLNKTFATQWTYPLNQNGASAGTYLIANGGTAPVFSSNFYSYKINRNGSCRVMIVLTGDGGTDGAGAVRAQVTLPYTHSIALQIDAAILRKDAATGGTEFVTARVSSSVPYFEMRDSAGGSENNADFSNGGREIIGSVEYWPF